MVIDLNQLRALPYGDRLIEILEEIILEGGGGAATDAAVAAFIADEDSATALALDTATVLNTWRNRPIVLNTVAPGPRAAHPSLVMASEDALYTQDDVGFPANSIYWPGRIDLKQGDPGVSPAERYAVKGSTDHAVGAAARLYAGRSAGLLDPVTDWGLLYQDTTPGTAQTETGQFFWNPADELWMGYHQQQGAGNGDQSTLLITSPDFVSWTRRGVVLELDSGFPGVGHFGYFRPFPWLGRIHGYSLAGRGYIAKWQSTDGGWTWRRDARIMPRCEDMLRHMEGYTPGEGWMVKWTNSSPIMWNGQTWIIAAAGAYASAGAETFDRLVTFPVDDDLRQPLDYPVDITPEYPEWVTIAQGLGDFQTDDAGLTVGEQRVNGPGGAVVGLQVV